MFLRNTGAKKEERAVKLAELGPGAWFRTDEGFFIKVDPVKIGGGFFSAYSLNGGEPRFASTSPEPPDMEVTPIDKPAWAK
ncbi:MAG: hypothetical protein WC465_03880 [Patescibacteria group bacterium]